MSSQAELRQQITDRIIDALEYGSLPPWRQPWSGHANARLPTNVVSKRRYSGVNPLLLRIAAERHGFRSKFWGTFNQWRQLGGGIRRRPGGVPPGHWGTSVVFFKPMAKTHVDPDTGEEEEIRFGLLKTYCVFNVDQVEGEHLDHLRVSDTATAGGFLDFEPAERVIEATGADIRYGGDRAFYRRRTPDGEGDFIKMPHRQQFSPPSEFYATALHELMHWSEHRLGWTGSYAEGELRAEIGACFALAELGVPQSDDLTNHHAYLRSWLEHLRRDSRFIFSASAAASRAADYVLGFSRQGEPEPVGEPHAVFA